jgi:hypothetical protein
MSSRVCFLIFRLIDWIEVRARVSPVLIQARRLHPKKLKSGPVMIVVTRAMMTRMLKTR